jgi:hypothetical protein
MDKLEVLGREFPEKGELSDLLVQTRQAKERASAIAQAMDQCDQFRREERFDKALEVVDVALAACPAEPALEAVRHEVEEQWRDFKSAAALRPILDEAEWLVEQDRPDLAVQFLRERAADFSDQPILVSRLTSIEEMLPEWRKQRFVQEALCRAGARAFDAAYCFGFYDGALRELIHLLKYDWVHPAAPVLARMLAAARENPEPCDARGQPEPHCPTRGREL